MAKGKYGREKDGAKGAGASGRKSSSAMQKRSQIFLRNLPLDMLEPDIETMIADCGPIKRIDLIKTTDPETGAKRSRGFGFVTFALEADARKSVDMIHGKRVMGREISCEIALKKGAKREGSEHESKSQIQRLAPPPTSGKPGAEGLSSDTYGKGSGAGEDSQEAPAVKQLKSTSQASNMDVDVDVKTGSESSETVGKGGVVEASESTSRVDEEKSEDPSGERTKQPAPPSKLALAAAAVAAAGAEAGNGVSKKEARKIAMKAMKKELKRKAKERAKEQEEAKSQQEASDQQLLVGAVEGDNSGAAVSTAKKQAMAEGPIANEDVDPKVAKLTEDAKTVLLFGVAADLTAKQLQKRVKKLASITTLSLDENERCYYPPGALARVVCAEKEGTRKIIAGIDGHSVHGQKLRARRLMEIVPGNDVRQQKQQRLIVRNLNFLAKEEDLMRAFTEFGPLAEVHIPTVKVTSQKRVKGTDQTETVTEDRSRGFGFVQFLCPRDAARVVKEHGVLKICGRDAAVDYSITKEKYNALQQGSVGEDKRRQTGPFDGDDLDEDEDAEEGDDSMMDVAPEGDDERDDSSVGIAEVANEAISDRSDVDDEDIDSDDDSDSDGDDPDQKEEGGPDAGAGGAAGPIRKPRTSDIEQGCTVFVRNVAFDCGDDEVKGRFSEYGAVRLALLVKDRSTGLPKGTAFVKFSTKTEADRCLAAAMGATDPTHARDSGGSCIYLGSRALHVTRAVDREEAGRLTVGAQKRKGHKDKRNLYLADEGLVLEESAAAEGAAKSDMEKRVQARRDKKTKLKNPLFFVSPVRLSVRNLARHVTDGKLKAMAASAARAGITSSRATPQDVRRYLEAQGEEFAAITPQRLKIPPVTASSVFKAKIIRDMDKKSSPDDPAELHPSKGYGFVEFAHHGQALAALRQMNNNPAFSAQAKSVGAVKGESSRLIVEFSVENHAKLKLQQSRKEAFEQRKRELKALGLAQDGRPMKRKDSPDEEKKSRGKTQRERKKQRMMSSGTGSSGRHGGDGDDAVSGTDPAPSAKTMAAGQVKKRKRTADKDGGRDTSTNADADNRALEQASPTEEEEASGVHDGTDASAAAEGFAVKEKAKRKRNTKKTRRFEHMDSRERAYQKLEKAYTAKTEITARGPKNSLRPAEGDQHAAAREATSPVKLAKRKAGRWFD